VNTRQCSPSYHLQTSQLIRLRIAATSFPNVPEGGGGGGGALGPEFEPPCGPSDARAIVGTANVSNAIRQRLDTATLSFFISILLLFRHGKAVTSRLMVMLI
jgi:hypothetical protein